MRNKIAIILVLSIITIHGYITGLSNAKGDSFEDASEDMKLHCMDVAYNDGQYVVVGRGDSTYDENTSSISGGIYSFKEDSKWSSSIISKNCWFNGVAYGKGRYVAVGVGGIIWMSADGITWSKQMTVYPAELNTVVWDGNKFIAGGINNIQYSWDGLKWEKIYISNLNIKSISASKKGYLAVGDGEKYLTSDNGVDWVEKSFVDPEDYDENSDIAYDDKLDLASVVWGGDQFVAVGIDGKMMLSADGESWDDINIDMAEDLLSVAWSGEYYICVGKSGVILFSKDGVKWARQSPENAENINKVIWTGVEFIAVGSNGLFMTSQDGVIWETKKPTKENLFSHISSNDKLVVGVSDDGTAIKSSDFKEWFRVDTGAKSKLNNITFVGDKFFAVGDSGTLVSSLDSENWNKKNLGSDALWDVTYFENTYVAVGDMGGIYYSTDGEKWVKAESRTFNDLKTITTDGDKAIVAGANGIILSSDDGIKWSEPSHVINENLYISAYKNGCFIAWGDGVMVYSLNGTDWTRKNYKDVKKVHALAFGDDGLEALDASGNLLNSSNGKEWAIVDSNDNFQNIVEYQGVCLVLSKYGKVIKSIREGSFNWKLLKIDDLLHNSEENARDLPADGAVKLAYGDKGFVAVGWNGTIVYCDKEDRWTLCKSGTLQNFEGVAWGNGKYVAVGLGDNILVSDDGINWIEANNKPESWLRNITYGDKGFVAAGDNGLVMASQDGMNWTKVNLYIQGELIRDVVWGNGKYIGVEGYGNILTSVDGISWDKSYSGIKKYFNHVVWGNGKYIATGYDGMYAISEDGINWKEMSHRDEIGDVIWNGKSFYALGNGSIYTSNDGQNWQAYYSDKLDGMLNIAWDGKQLVLVGNNWSVSKSNMFQNELSKRLEDTLIMKLESPIAFVDGKQSVIDMNNTGLTPLVINDRTLVPVRFISEKFGGGVEWNEATSTATIKTTSEKITLTLGCDSMYVNDKEYKLDVAACSIDDRIFIPLRAIVENGLGKRVFYDKGIIIISGKDNMISDEIDENVIEDILKMFE